MPYFTDIHCTCTSLHCVNFLCAEFFLTPGLPPAEVVPMHFQRSDSIVGSPAKPFLIGRSRLETEFEELEVLGSGGFGDVIKVGWNDVMVVMSYYNVHVHVHVGNLG